MLTPELQQYINQQRTVGVSDSQIRQNLEQQGWSQADLDQAFGIIPQGPAVPQAPVKTPMPTWAKWLIGVVIFFFILPGLIWLGIIGFGIYAVKHSGVSYTNTGTTRKTNTKKPLNCDDLELNSTGLGKLSPTLPSSWPSDIPIYPDSKLLGSTGLTFGGNTKAYDQVAYCSKDGVDQIAKFFIDSRSGWIFTRNFTQSQASNQTNAQGQFLIGKKSGPSGVYVSITNTSNGADTLIIEGYGGSTPK